MSYQRLGSWWSEAAQVVQSQKQGATGYAKSKEPAVNLIDVWAGIVTNLRAKQGNTAFRVRGVNLPCITLKQENDLYEAWKKIGDQVLVELKKKGRESDLLESANRANYRFTDGWAKLVGKRSLIPTAVRTTAPGCTIPALWAPEAQAFFDLVSRYAIELNGVLWAIDNIESDYERWVEAMPYGTKTLFKAGWYTAKDVTPVVKEVFTATVEAVKSAAGAAYYTAKYGPYVAVAAGALYLFLKVRAK